MLVSIKNISTIELLDPIRLGKQNRDWWPWEVVLALHYCPANVEAGNTVVLSLPSWWFEQG